MLLAEEKISKELVGVLFVGLATAALGKEACRVVIGREGCPWEFDIRWVPLAEPL